MPNCALKPPLYSNFALPWQCENMKYSSITLLSPDGEWDTVKTRIDLFPKRHRLVHNGGFPNFEALYCSLNMVNSTEIS